MGCDEKRTDVDSVLRFVACSFETFVENAAAPSPLRTKIPTSTIDINFFILFPQLKITTSYINSFFSVINTFWKNLGENMVN
jgi:hypothetical protein